MKQPLPYVFFCLFLFFLTACHPTEIDVKPLLLSAEQLVIYDNPTLKRLTSGNDSISYQPADYQINIYRLVYQTTLDDGTTITASGIVYVPSQLKAAGAAYPLLSFQHPTAFSDIEAPSGSNFSVASFSYPLYFATHGYIVACPDYLGYGAASQIPHDYEHRQTLARATVDMLLATKEFLVKKAIGWTNQVFLTGYSEGGYATLSAQKLLEERYGQLLQVTGSSCGAGPYAMPAFFDYVTQHPTTGGVANHIYAWETLSYNRIYRLNKPISYYFKAPYAELLTKSLDNARTIPLSFDQLCTDQFRVDVRDPSSAFSKALADNDLSGWTTQTPTQFIHSEQDEIIPFLTTQQTYTSMRQDGSSNLSLVALKKGAHVPTEALFMSRSLAWFERLRK